MAQDSKCMLGKFICDHCKVASVTAALAERSPGVLLVIATWREGPVLSVWRDLHVWLVSAALQAGGLMVAGCGL